MRPRFISRTGARPGAGTVLRCDDLCDKTPVADSGMPPTRPRGVTDMKPPRALKSTTYQEVCPT